MATLPYNPFDINRSVENVFGVNPATDLKGIPRWGNESEYGDNGTKSPKTMQQIKNNILSPALTSHYGVEIGIPNALRGMLSNAGGQQTQLNLMCTEATLPGSNLATMEINNNFTGVTERHAYRRVFDDRINLTFYVDSQNYLPIRFFEAWQSYIMNENQNDPRRSDYSYRTRYPDGDGGYTATGLRVKKFERDYRNELTYEFVKSYPISITSMPVSYDTSSLLKCTVAMTYLRYVVIQTPDFAATASNNSIEPNLTQSQQAELEYALAQEAMLGAQNNWGYQGPGSFAYDEHGNVTGVNP
jgi:hypothetical protein